MARPLHVEYPGAFYHVINQGNNKEDIFISDRDRERFLGYLAKSNDRFQLLFIAIKFARNRTRWIDWLFEAQKRFFLGKILNDQFCCQNGLFKTYFGLFIKDI
jgi:hypothetical protein